MPRARNQFLDLEEKEILESMQVMTREDLWNLLEKKRFEDLELKTVKLSGLMIAHSRCPKCTLPPPCNHFESTVAISLDAAKILNIDKYKQAIAPAKREYYL